MYVIVYVCDGVCGNVCVCVCLCVCDRWNCSVQKRGLFYNQPLCTIGHTVLTESFLYTVQITCKVTHASV